MSELKERVRSVIIEANTSAGKGFEVVLKIFISLSISAVLLDSITSINERIGRLLSAAEWAFAIIFTVDYLIG